MDLGSALLGWITRPIPLPCSSLPALLPFPLSTAFSSGRAGYVPCPLNPRPRAGLIAPPSHSFLPQSFPLTHGDSLNFFARPCRAPCPALRPGSTGSYCRRLARAQHIPVRLAFASYLYPHLTPRLGCSPTASRCRKAQTPARARLRTRLGAVAHGTRSSHTSTHYLLACSRPPLESAKTSTIFRTPASPHVSHLSAFPSPYADPLHSVDQSSEPEL